MYSHSYKLIAHRSSRALLSRNAESDVCMVFVHGFLGDAVTTWEDFQGLCSPLLEQSGEVLGRSDLYFFDYRAEANFINSSASELDAFLKGVFPKPAMILFDLPESKSVLIREPWLPYRHLVLVGHSLGCVVIRACVERQFRAQTAWPPWLVNSDLRLFASAQGGFSPNGFKGFLALALGHLGRYPLAMRAFRELRDKSTALTDLRRRTEKLAVTNPGLGCLRPQLVYGKLENIVASLEYDCDEPAGWIDDHDHISVCKPTTTFLDPFEFVTRNVLKKPARA